MRAQMVGSYQLVEQLGQGGFGEVYRALDTRRGRVVALKLLLPGPATGPRVEEARFRRECRLAARLASPHIIPIHDFGVLDGRLFLDMRLVEDGDLRRLLAEHGRLPAARTVEIVRQIAEALDSAHGAGLVHRDVKPANVLVSRQRDHDFVYLADFGIVRPVDPQRTRITESGAVPGTPTYMAPETLSGAAAEAAADIYALGCILFECLAGRPPFEGQLVEVIGQHLGQPPPRASARCADVPAELDDVIAIALAKDPAQRYPTAGDLAAAADRALRASTPPGPAGNSSTNTAPPTGPSGVPRELIRFAHGTGGVHRAVYSPDGTVVATSGDDRTVRVWDAATGAERLSLTLDRIGTPVFSPDGSMIASVRSVRTAGVWDVGTGRELMRAAHQFRFRGRAISNGEVTTLAFSPDSEQLASGGADATARTWDITTGREVTRVAHDLSVRQVRYSPAGRWLATAAEGRQALRLSDAATGETVWWLNRKAVVRRVAFSPDGRRIACSGSGIDVFVYDLTRADKPVHLRHDFTFWRLDSLYLQFSPTGHAS